MTKELKIQQIIDSVNEVICNTNKAIYRACVDSELCYDIEENDDIVRAFDNYDITNTDLIESFSKNLKKLKAFCEKNNITII